jgi:hypothetical protein
VRTVYPESGADTLEAPSLAPAPRAPVDASGQPAFGAYAGECAEISWARLDGPYARNALWRLLHLKRWHYVSLAGPDLCAALLVADVGYAANAFLYLFDRKERLLLADRSFLGIPGLMAEVAAHAGPGARTRWNGAGAEITFDRGANGWTLLARAPGDFAVEASLALPAAPTLCAVARIEGGVANCTHKTLCLPAQGEVRVGGRRFDLDGHFGALDHTSGLLARDTSWRWASATRGDLGVNLVQGFNGAVENAVWLDGRVYPVGAAEISYDVAAPQDSWRIRTVDGAVDLTFRPEGERRKDVDLYVARSRYLQGIGAMSGRLRVGGREVQVTDLCGVTEDHSARW